MECITSIDGPELARKNVEISTICYLKNYSLIAVGTDLGRIFFWDLTRSIYLKNDYEKYFKHKGYISCIISNEDGKKSKDYMFSSSHDGLILVWEIEKIEIKESKKSSKDDFLPKIETKPQIKFTFNFKFHPQIKWLLNTPNILQAAENLELKSSMSSNLININQSDHQIYVIAFSNNTPGVIYSGGNDCKINLWNFEKETYLASFKGHKTSICSMTFDKNYLISGSMDGEIMIWNTYDQSHLMTLSDSSQSRILDIMMIPNYGILVSITNDKKINFWRYESKELLKSISMKQESLCLSIVQSYGKLLCGTKEKTILETDLTELFGSLNIQHDYKKFHFMEDEINYTVDINDNDIDNFKIMKSLNMELNKGIHDI